MSGAAFQAGLAVVILAIVLDRLTDHAGEWMDPRFRKTDRDPARQRVVYLVALGVVVAGVVYAQTLADPTAFPGGTTIDLREPVNEIVAWIKSTFIVATTAIKDFVAFNILNPIQTVLTSSPWWLVVGVVFCGAWYISGLRPAVTAAACLLLAIGFGLGSTAWRPSPASSSRPR